MSDSKKGTSLAFAYTNKRKGTKTPVAKMEPEDKQPKAVEPSKNDAIEAKEAPKKQKVESTKRPMPKGHGFSVKGRDDKDEEPKKYAEGGEVDLDESDPNEDIKRQWHEKSSAVMEHEPAGHTAEAGADMNESMQDVQMAAEGGLIGDDELEEHYDSITSAIMARRLKSALGSGEADIHENEEEAPADPSEYDEMNEEAADDEDFDDTMDKMNKKDRVSAIMSRRKK